MSLSLLKLAIEWSETKKDNKKYKLNIILNILLVTYKKQIE